MWRPTRDCRGDNFQSTGFCFKFQSLNLDATHTLFLKEAVEVDIWPFIPCLYLSIIVVTKNNGYLLNLGVMISQLWRNIHNLRTNFLWSVLDFKLCSSAEKISDISLKKLYETSNSPACQIHSGKRRFRLLSEGSGEDTIEVGLGSLKMSFSIASGELKRMYNSKTGVSCHDV